MKTLIATLVAASMAALAVLAGPPEVATLQAPTASQEAPRASGPIDAADIPLPPMEDRVDTAVMGPVFFVSQKGMDEICGGQDDVVACAVVGTGGWMALPNPNQERFAGESYAALVAHEMGHTNGWRHGN